MGVYIQEMKIPFTCGECYLRRLDGYCPLAKQTMRSDLVWCNYLKEVPAPHCGLNSINRERVLSYISDMQLGIAPDERYQGAEHEAHEYAYQVLEWVFDGIKDMPSEQPEIAHITIGKSRDGITMWYECDKCGEPVDFSDNFCRSCGRSFTDVRGGGR